MMLALHVYGVQCICYCFDAGLPLNVDRLFMSIITIESNKYSESPMTVGCYLFASESWTLFLFLEEYQSSSMLEVC